MQTRILAILGQSSGQEHVTNPELLADINRVHRFDIPERVGGGRFRQQLSVTVPASTAARQDINTSGLTISPSSVLFGAIVGDWARTLPSGQSASADLRVYTDPISFWDAYDPAITTEVTTPEAILIEETSFILRPIPSVAQTLYFEALVYRAALTQVGSITLDFEELAIVYGAAGYAAVRIGDEDVIQRMERYASEQMGNLIRNVARSSSVSLPPPGDF